MKTWETAVAILSKAVKAGVGEFVVCGGARNALLLEVLSKMEAAGKVKVWSHFEERSAGFFALGRTMETGMPCAVVVTSGTAVAELFPAAIEGFYQARPLVLMTADRPPEFRRSGAPQAVEQVGIFAEYTSTDLETWNGMLPLHINIELGEAFEIGDDDFSSIELGDFSIDLGRPNVGELARWIRERTLRGLVVMVGQLELCEQEEVFHFCEALDVPVVADATSGLREALQHLVLVGADTTLKSYPPSKILRLGGVPSGRFWRDLEELPKVDVWSVCRNGLRGLGRDAKVLQGSLDRILSAIGEVEKIGDVSELLEGVEGRGQELEEALEAFPDSEPSWIRTLSVFASIGESVYLGNSLPIREWNTFGQWERAVQNVRANRGANGIDGQVSSWLGASAEEENAWGIFGDLTTLYDLAGLKMLAQVKCQGRVMVVINNSGGQIFSRVSRLGDMSESAKRWMVAETPADFHAVAKLWGMDYQKITRTDEFDGIENSERATLVEVVPDVSQTRKLWERLGQG